MRAYLLARCAIGPHVSLNPLCAVQTRASRSAQTGLLAASPVCSAALLACRYIKFRRRRMQQALPEERSELQITAGARCTARRAAPESGS